MSLPWWGIYLRGLAMGAADVVPGVSGGTVAFLTGIYERLLEAIRAVHPRLWRLRRERGWGALWQAVDGNFLSLLVAGIVTSIVSLARIITWALAEHRILLMAFFFGLILASILYLLRLLRPLRGGAWFCLVLGCGVALGVVGLNPMTLPATLPWLFCGGAIAICAMILPGVSGSFLLLLLGLYEPVLTAVRDLDAVRLGVFMAGCVTGLLSFSHALGWLLRHWRQPTLALLTGFLLGSLALVWPWRLPEGTLLSPLQYAAETGLASQWPVALLVTAGGFAMVMGLDWLAMRRFKRRQ